MMKRLFLVAAVMVISLHGQELMRNICFSESVKDPDAIEIMGSRGVSVKGDRVPAYWLIGSTWKKGGAKAEYRGREKWILDSGQALLDLSARNYRIGRKEVEAGKWCFLLKGTGAAKGNIGLYCYAQNGKFIQNVKAGEFAVTENAGVAAVEFDIRTIPADCAWMIPHARFSGKITLSSFSFCNADSIGTETAEDIRKMKLPEKFGSWSKGEKIRFVMNCDSAVLIIKAAEGQSSQIRRQACFRLGQLGDKGVAGMAFLVEHAKQKEEAQRTNAAVALTRLGRAAYPEIRTLLNSADRGIRLCMGSAVRGMPLGVPPELAEDVDWASPPNVQEGPTQHPDSGFEGASVRKLWGWKVEFKDGAQGSWQIDDSVSYEGYQSLKIIKTNGIGYILVSSTRPICVPAGIRNPWTFRFHYRCTESMGGTLLMPRFITPDGRLKWDDTRINGGAGWQSQSLLRNTPGNSWQKRLIVVGGRKQPQYLRPAAVIYGNPVTVWLDKMDFPAAPWQAADAGRTYSSPRYSLEEALKIVRRRKPVSVRIEKSPQGRSVLAVNGRKVAPVFFLNTNGYIADHGLFCNEAGGHFPIVMVSLNGSRNYPPFHEPWKGGETPDYGALLSCVEQAVRKAPQANLILGLNIVWPYDYIDRHPQEAWLDAKGNRAYGTAVHLAGFAEKLPESPDSRYFWWPSQYSQPAWQEAGKIVRGFLQELKKKEYARIIAGVFITGGHDGQFHIHKRDYGSSAKMAWRNYLRNQYGSDSALAEAWQQPGATIEGAEIPPEQPSDSKDALFYHPGRHSRFADFKKMEERQVWKNVEFFARIFKEVFGRDKLAVSWCLGGGWRKDFRYFFHSDVLDAFTGQPLYHYRQPGYSGGFNMVAESCHRHGKIAISELDTRNWMRGIYNEVVTMRIGTPMSSRHFRSTIFKEAGRMIAAGEGFWFYDMQNGIFRHPEAVETLRIARQTADAVAGNAASEKSPAGVALVFHQDSIFWDVPQSFGARGNLPSMLVDEQLFMLRISGVPADSIYLSDLMQDRAYEKYRVFIFMNAFRLSSAERKFIREKLQKNGNTLIWQYAAGILDEKQFNPENVGKITGISLRYSPERGDMMVLKEKKENPLLKNVSANMGVADIYRRRFELGALDYWKHCLPRFVIEDRQAEILGRYTDGGGALAVKDFPQWTSVYCASPGGLDPWLFYNIACRAGVYTVTTPGLVVEMNCGFISLHGIRKGRYQLQLPRRYQEITDAATGTVLARKTDRLTVNMEAQESRWLLLK